MTKLTAQEWGLYVGNIVLVDVAKMFKSFSTFAPQRFTLKGCNSGKLFVFGDQNGLSGDFEVDTEHCKLMLRDLSQMTEDEHKEFHLLFDEHIDSIIIKNEKEEMWFDTPELTDWITRKGFAIRGEFERGVAVREGGQ